MSYWESLTGRLFKLVFGGYVILAIVVTAFQLTLEYSSIQKAIAKDLAALGQSFNGGVAGALWELDHPLLKTMAQGISQSSIVTGVRISSDTGETFAAVGELPSEPKSGSGSFLAPFQFNTTLLARQTPTGRRQLGQLTIYSDRSVALDRIEYSFFVILINSLIKTAGLWLIFYLVISKSLSRPLSQLTGVVSRLEFAAESKEAISLDYPHQDELGRLMGAMGRMQERLFTARDELEQANLRLEETVTERTQNLADALAFNETVLLNSPVPMGVYAASGECVLANDAYVEFVGATREAVLAQNFRHLASWQKSGLLDDSLIALERQTMQQREVHMLSTFGKDLYCECRILPTKLHGQDHLLVQLFDLTERKHMEEELRHVAFHDSLTGLPNRRLLMDRLGLALRASKRRNSSFAVLFLDLNKFKLLNDTRGHDIGDKLLVEVADRLQRVVRDSDTVARFGGDEFVVLLEGLGSQPDQVREYVASIANKIRTALSEEYVLGDIRHQGSVSIGITLSFGDEREPGQILKEADVAMYQAKEAGRNMICFHQAGRT